MNDQATTATINAKLNTLISARNEDLEARREDRERRDRERQEDRQMMHEMSGHISQMAIAITEQTKNNEHLNQRVDKIEAISLDHTKELKTISNKQSGNAVRWQVLIAGIASFIALGGVFVTIILWLFDKFLGNP